MNKKFIIGLAFVFLTCSCTGTKNIKSSEPEQSSKSSSSFLSEIKKIQKENNISVTDARREEVKKEPAVSNETLATKPVVENKVEEKPVLKEEPKKEIQPDLNAVPKSDVSTLPESDVINKKKIDTEPSLAIKKIEEVDIIESSPADGIIVDESAVDNFEEKYVPLNEKDGFKEAEEENLAREEMQYETAPSNADGLTAVVTGPTAALPEAETEDDVVNIVDKDALEEFEALKKLQDIKDLGELNDLKKVEALEKLIESEEITYDVPIVINEKVEYFIEYFQGPKTRKIFTKWLSRSTKYLPMMRKIFEDKGLPKDLTYLAMIESGFNTSAYSRARACGPWQFIKGTGLKYGLRIDHWVDERRDPEKATIAAANYLKDLYGMFGSWYLAAAAYNAGEGKIDRALKRYNTEDFWELTKGKYLKKETKHYIPKYLAAMLISKDPAKYGFDGYDEQGLYDYDVVDIESPTDLDIIAKSAGVTLADVKELNPELKSWYTPPEREVYKLKLPKNTKDTFIANFSKVKPTEKINFLTYKLRHGETLSYVANRFGTTVSTIMKTNKIKSAKYVRAGIELTIPIKGGTNIASYKEEVYESKIKESSVILVPKGETIPYTVEEGDSLWDIAKRSGVDVTDIISLNNIKNSKIYPGKKILLYKQPPEKTVEPKVEQLQVASNRVNDMTVTAPVSVGAVENKIEEQVEGDNNYHTVEVGDSLWSIAKKYNLTIKELKSMNNLKARSEIHPNQKLLVVDDSSATNENIQVASLSVKGNVTYTVKKGDTLWDIAKKHNMDISEIKSLNNLKNNYIKPGDELKVK